MRSTAWIMSDLKNKAEYILETQIAPFWLSLKDKKYGGFYGRKDASLRLHEFADKGSIMTSRILYFFSEAYSLTGRTDYLEAARSAFDFLTKYCIDREFGGVYWSVTYDGKPADTIKHTYAQAFAIYGLASYYLVTNCTDAILEAFRLFNIIEHKCSDSGGYLESFARDWKPAENDKLSENNVIAARTMNTLLHIFESYTRLYQCVPDERVRAAMKKILEVYRDKVYNNDKMRQEVFFDESFNSLIDLQSFGHDIESSWLIDAGCSLIDDDRLKEEIYAINSCLARKVYEEAFTGECVLNECENGRTDTDRIWWVQAEAVTGFIGQWQKTNEPEYLSAALKVFSYIQENLVDKRQGSEWFWGIHENGVPMEKDMAGEWKCPYHNGRMCFEIIRRARDDT